MRIREMGCEHVSEFKWKSDVTLFEFRYEVSLLASRYAQYGVLPVHSELTEAVQFVSCILTCEISKRVQTYLFYTSVYSFGEYEHCIEITEICSSESDDIKLNNNPKCRHVATAESRVMLTSGSIMHIFFFT